VYRGISMVPFGPFKGDHPKEVIMTPHGDLKVYSLCTINSSFTTIKRAIKGSKDGN
jgi:hypothetical protein